MPKTVQYMLLFGWILALAVASSTPTRTGYPRPNRGFKSQGLSTARGFGKRSDSGLNLVQGSFMGSPAGGLSSVSQSNIESLLPLNFDIRTSYPNSWLIEEIQNNPEAARLIVEKIIDENGDGELSPEELYKRIYY